MLSLFPPSKSKIKNLAEALHGEQRKHALPRPWVMSSMAYSLNGSMAVHGRSEGLSSKTDREILKIFRSISDVILVGAETVRAEQYGAPVLSPALQQLRVDQGKPALPTLAIVSQSLRFDDALPLFSSSTYKPLVLTSESAQVSAEVAKKIDIVRLGKTSVDFSLVMEYFTEKKFAVVLSEGGPAITQQLLEKEFLDEWNMALSPTLVSVESAVTSSQYCSPSAVTVQHKMELVRLWEHEGFLFSRWIT